jgi:hypothetical protein
MPKKVTTNQAISPSQLTEEQKKRIEARGYDNRTNEDKVFGHLEKSIPGMVLGKDKRTVIYEETTAKQMANQGKYGKKYIIDAKTGKKTYLQD